MRSNWLTTWSWARTLRCPLSSLTIAWRQRPAPSCSTPELSATTENKEIAVDLLQTKWRSPLEKVGSDLNHILLLKLHRNSFNKLINMFLIYVVFQKSGCPSDWSMPVMDQWSPLTGWSSCQPSPSTSRSYITIKLRRPLC